MEAVATPEIYGLTDLIPFLAGVSLGSFGWPALIMLSYLSFSGI